MSARLATIGSRYCQKRETKQKEKASSAVKLEQMYSHTIIERYPEKRKEGESRRINGYEFPVLGPLCNTSLLS